MPLYVTHLSGAGNNFLIFDAMHDTPFDGPRLALSLCKKHKADGLVILTKNTPSKAPIVWSFYNQDGSAASMCGNAARCVAHYVSAQQGLPSCSLQMPNTQAATPPFLKTCSTPKGYKVQMPPITQAQWQQTLNSPQHKANIVYDFINTGVPHVVIHTAQKPADTPASTPVASTHWQQYQNLAQFIQQHPRFAPHSTNVSFYFQHSTGTLHAGALQTDALQAVSFERGLQNSQGQATFTQACGTGAVACGAALRHLQPNTPLPQNILMPGGSLWLDWQGEVPYLEGPVTEIGRYPCL